ncbi:MAG: hypothetical protein VX988_12530 [Planctomycetota bacterium]|nr:hypothetical protein [Planctomycetota bacterium]
MPPTIAGSRNPPDSPTVLAIAKNLCDYLRAAAAPRSGNSCFGKKPQKQMAQRK